MASGSEINFEQHSQLEGLVSALPLMLGAPRESPRSLRLEDLKALRLTSKALKQLIDPRLFRKMEIKINTSYLGNENKYKYLSQSSILRHVKDCWFRRMVNHPDMKPLWNRQGRFFVAMLSECAPQLDRLYFSTSSNPDDFPLISNVLNGTSDNFPHLKSLELHSSPGDIVEVLVQKRLYSMPWVEKLVLAANKTPFDKENIPLDVIAHTPFLENLLEMNLEFLKANKDLSAVLTCLVLYSRRLVKLKLAYPAALQIGNAVSIKDLQIDHCSNAGNLVLPPSLVRLRVATCVFSSNSAMSAVFNRANLPQLTSLTFEISRITSKNLNWTEFLEQMDLDTLEELKFLICPGLTANDAFSIGQHASKFPQLKRFDLLPLPSTESSIVVDSALFRRFVGSARAVRLESLEIAVEFGGDGVQQLASNASNMPFLQNLSITIHTEGDLRALAQARTLAGHWPLLKKMTLNCLGTSTSNAGRLLSSIENCRELCKDVLEPIYGPGLDLTVWAPSGGD